MSILGTLLPALGFLDTIVQDNTLAREFYDALYPELLYRADAIPEKWEANLGDRMIFTRSSLLNAQPNALTPGVDPAPQNPSYEQWSVQAAQYGSSTDTHMPSSRTALAPVFARNAKTLGLNAGQTLNRLARDKLFYHYLGGDTLTLALGAAVTAVPVASINGFTTVIVAGQEVPVSPGNTKAVTISGVAGTQQVTAAVPADPNVPLGPGTLTVSVAINFAADAKVRAFDAPTIIRVGAQPTIDTLTGASILTFKDVREAVAVMRRNRVPPHEDGYYHVHLDPIAEAQLFGDNEFQRMFQGLPEDYRYMRFVVGIRYGCVFFSNSESPAATNTGTLIATRGSAGASPEIFAEVTNKSGIGIIRTIITGGGTLMEKYIDEQAEYVSEAGYQGKVGSFSIVNNGIQVAVERCRYIIRAPQDRLQQIVSQSWSASLDFGVPSDLLGGQTPARFKRAVVIESGTTY